MSQETVIVGGCQLSKNPGYLYADSSRLFYKSLETIISYDLSYLKEAIIDVHCAPYSVTLLQTTTKLVLYNYLKDSKRLIKHRLYKLPKDFHSQSLNI